MQSGITSTSSALDPFNSNQLRGAITTSKDEYTAFEDELLEEINLLRRDPKSYAELLEEEATIGYPYICSDDLYFDSDEKVVACGARIVPVKTPSVPEPGTGKRDRTHRNNSNNTNDDDAGMLSAPASAERRIREGSQAHGGRMTASESTQSFVHKEIIITCGEGPGGRGMMTLKDVGICEMNVEQLRLFFMRHQKYRMQLEKTVRDLVHQWQLADQNQHDAWAAEDAQNVKKIKRGGRKKSTTTSSSDEVSRQRTTLSEQLSLRYLEHLRTLMRMLFQSRDTCKRAMDGANLMLDCIRALREAQPVPQLRGSRGLKLAARDTGHFFHKDADMISRAFSAHQFAIDSVCPSRVTAAAFDGAAAGDGEGMPQFDARNAADAIHYFEEMWTTGLSCPQAERTNDLRLYIDSLANVTQQACSEYGYVSGEVRGVQLYGTGSPRAIVMKALLGVATPIFGFRELHPAEQKDSSRPSPRNGISLDRGSPFMKPFGDSIFNISDLKEPIGGDLELSPSPLSKELKGDGISQAMKTTTGLMFGGTFNPTSASAARFAATGENTMNTSAGKRAALAVQRLGPLLWPEAHLLGCGWQRVVSDKPVPAYDDREEKPMAAAEDSSEVVVSTTLMVAAGYEELDLIEQHKHMGLAEVRRIVHYEDEALAAGGARSVRSSRVGGEESTVLEGGLTGASPDRPAVVDMHSSLNVSLLYPKKHPVQLDETTQTAWLALSADPHRVQIVATLTGAQEARPHCPAINFTELMVQPSNWDSNVVLVLINVAAARAKALDGKVLVHIFEFDKQSQGDTGYEHIGFVRLSLFHAPSFASCATSPIRGSARQGRPNTQLSITPPPRPPSQRSRAAQSVASIATVASSTVSMVNHCAMMTSTPVDLWPLIRDLRLSPHPSIAIPGALSPRRPSWSQGGIGASSAFSLGSSKSQAYGSWGWPTCFADFFDRSATLLGPLAGCLVNTNEVCRVSIFIPHSTDYLQQQINLLLDIDRELAEKEGEELIDEEDESYTSSKRSSFAYSEPLESVEDDATSHHTAPTKQEKAPGKAAPSKKASADPKAAAPTDNARQQRNSIQLMDEATREQLVALPPTSANQYIPGAKVHLSRLHELSTRLAEEATVCRSRYAKAEAQMTAQITEIDLEIEKRKGREVMKLKTEVEVLKATLEEMHKRVVEAEDIATTIRLEILERERNGVVRRSRRMQIASELELLRMKCDRSNPLNVKLWFTGRKSCAPLAVDSKHLNVGAPFLPPLQDGPSSPSGVFDCTLTPLDTASNCGKAAPLPLQENHVVQLQPIDSSYSTYEADFMVPVGFEGRALLMLNGQELICWKVIGTQ